MLVAFVGIIFAITRWQRHPTVSLLTLVAFSLLLFDRLIWVAFQIWQFVDYSSSTSTHVFTIMRVVSLILYVGAQALLIAAVFGWRSTPNTFGKGV